MFISVFSFCGLIRHSFVRERSIWSFITSRKGLEGVECFPCSLECPHRLTLPVISYQVSVSRTLEVISTLAAKMFQNLALKAGRDCSGAWLRSRKTTTRQSDSRRLCFGTKECLNSEPVLDGIRPYLRNFLNVSFFCDHSARHLSSWWSSARID